MKRAFGKLIRKLIRSGLNKTSAERLMGFLSHEFNIDPLDFAHHRIGIMKYETPEVSGEAFLMNHLLRPYFDRHDIREPVIFDVGANKGSYAKELTAHLPTAHIYAFEPNPRTSEILKQNTAGLNRITCHAIGLGSEVKTSSIFTYKNELDSEHASLFKEVLQDLHKATDIEELVISIDTLDHFCAQNNIGKINFLKIDTEGFELEVLKGARESLNGTMIDFIQFEFNEMNVSSRVFLKDFYDLLPGYTLYRLDSYQLISLEHYHAVNEIFRFQNILAIRKGVNLNG